MTERKAWLLQTPEEREVATGTAQPGLLAAGLYSAMQHNEELREEVLKLQKNLDDAVELIGILNAKIALLSTLNKHGTGQNNYSTTSYEYDTAPEIDPIPDYWEQRDI